MIAAVGSFDTPGTRYGIFAAFTVQRFQMPQFTMSLRMRIENPLQVFIGHSSSSYSNSILYFRLQLCKVPTLCARWIIGEENENEIRKTEWKINKYSSNAFGIQNQNKQCKCIEKCTFNIYKIVPPFRFNCIYPAIANRARSILPSFIGIFVIRRETRLLKMQSFWKSFWFRAIFNALFIPIFANEYIYKWITNYTNSILRVYITYNYITFNTHMNPYYRVSALKLSSSSKLDILGWLSWWAR